VSSIGVRGLPFGYRKRVALRNRLRQHRAWRHLPPSFGVTVPTAHRRFTEWTKAGLWPRVHRAVLDELGGQGMIDWSRVVVDAAAVRAKKGDR